MFNLLLFLSIINLPFPCISLVAFHESRPNLLTKTSELSPFVSIFGYGKGKTYDAIKLCVRKKRIGERERGRKNSINQWSAGSWPAISINTGFHLEIQN